MKKYLLLPIAAAFMVSPALAQDNNSNSSNLKPQSDVIKGAEESAKPGPKGSGMEVKTDRSAAGESNSSNLKPGDDVLKGAEDSAKPKPMTGNGSSVTPTGSDTNSGNLNK
jgi:hypothetical protein